MNTSQIAALIAVVGSAAVSAVAAGRTFGPWSAAVNMQSIPGTHPELNTVFSDGCPTLARDDRTLYLASNRPGGEGGLDIWVATRDNPDAAWGEPINVGPPVNTPADEFCPSPARDGHLFFFVSTRAGGCGGADIYMTRRRDEHHPWDEPVNLGCEINSPAGEASPFLIQERAAGAVLYFSSNRVGGYSADPPDAATGDDDLYSADLHGQRFLAPALVPGVNSPFNDSRPNLRRDGLELFFDSNREGTLGASDIFSAVRARVDELWSIPEPLGPIVNSPAAETRPSLSWDGTTLVFGSTRAGGEGSTDVYMTTRGELTGQVR